MRGRPGMRPSTIGAFMLHADQPPLVGGGGGASGELVPPSLVGLVDQAYKSLLVSCRHKTLVGLTQEPCARPSATACEYTLYLTLLGMAASSSHVNRACMRPGAARQTLPCKPSPSSVNYGHFCTDQWPPPDSVTSLTA